MGNCYSCGDGGPRGSEITAEAPKNYFAFQYGEKFGNTERVDNRPNDAYRQSYRISTELYGYRSPQRAKTSEPPQQEIQTPSFPTTAGCGSSAS